MANSQERVLLTIATLLESLTQSVDKLQVVFFFPPKESPIPRVNSYLGTAYQNLLCSAMTEVAYIEMLCLQLILLFIEYHLCPFELQSGFSSFFLLLVLLAAYFIPRCSFILLLQEIYLETLELTESTPTYMLASLDGTEHGYRRT
ncbi:hypothetical protein Tco_0067110 [Tanacetum coccineum]